MPALLLHGHRSALHQHCLRPWHRESTLLSPHVPRMFPPVQDPSHPSIPQIQTSFAPGDAQGFALVNRQHSTRVDSGFGVQLRHLQAHLTYESFGELPPDSYYWQLPPPYQGDKVTE